MNPKTLFLLLIISGFSATLSAQPYENAVGIRAGYSSGFNFRHFFDHEYAYDIQVLYNAHGFQLTGLYTYQISPYNKKRLFYYAGAGLYGGNWDDEFATGAAISLGSEFVFRAAPITLGLEWKPMINVYKLFDYVLYDFAVTFRVVL